VRKRFTPTTGLAFCTAPVGVAGTAPVELAGFSLGSEAIPLALVLWMFLGAGIWVFRRWGRAPGAPASDSAQPAAGVRA
jgi:hypothetical protein